MRGHSDPQITGKGPNPSGKCACGCQRNVPIATRGSTSRGWVKGQPIRFIDGHTMGGKKGPLSPTYKHGLYCHGNFRSEDLQHKVWAKAVRARDRRTCQHCFRFGIVAHHTFSYAHHPALRYVVANGLTMCRPCHQKLHHILRITQSAPPPATDQGAAQ